MTLQPSKVDSILAGVLEKHGVRETVGRVTLLEGWDEIVGEKLAGVTNPRGVDDTTLIIEVRSSAWMMELNMMKREFLSRVNEHMADLPVERIVFVLAETR